MASTKDGKIEVIDETYFKDGKEKQIKGLTDLSKNEVIIARKEIPSAWPAITPDDMALFPIYVDRRFDQPAPTEDSGQQLDEWVLNLLPLEMKDKQEIINMSKKEALTKKHSRRVQKFNTDEHKKRKLALMMKRLNRAAIAYRS
jgi:hypothetical protein